MQRDLTGPSQAQSIRDLLQSLFLLEIIKPSKRIWLGSAWISDIAIINNRAKQCASFEPDWLEDYISLVKVLEAVAKRGTEIIIITRNEKTNQSFIEKINQVSKVYSNVKLLLKDEFHEKGLLGTNYELMGSMNFTFNGIQINDEHIKYTYDKEVAAQRQVEMMQKYGRDIS
ncbi:phospholipase D-like domain-containing protein DpdK [Sulfurovum sp.]|uniref:phospholipase D-like domain-containing protein DpdK n=1 Tax=Sulfurovum sp. TaxID=1969726 RepID=UPI00356B5007